MANWMRDDFRDDAKRKKKSRARRITTEEKDGQSSKYLYWRLNLCINKQSFKEAPFANHSPFTAPSVAYHLLSLNLARLLPSQWRKIEEEKKNDNSPNNELLCAQFTVYSFINRNIRKKSFPLSIVLIKKKVRFLAASEKWPSGVWKPWTNIDWPLGEERDKTHLKLRDAVSPSFQWLCQREIYSTHTKKRAIDLSFSLYVSLVIFCSFFLSSLYQSKLYVL